MAHSKFECIEHLFYSRRMAGVGEAWLDEAEAASALFDADLPPLPPDPDFPDPAAFAARVEAWDTGRLRLPGDPGRPLRAGDATDCVPRTSVGHRARGPGRRSGADGGLQSRTWPAGPVGPIGPVEPVELDADGVVSPDPDDLDAGDLIPFRPGPASRVEVLEWELCGADERDEAEAAMLAARAPGWVRLPPGGGLAAALEGVRPSVESPVALIEVMRACDRQVAWLESVKVAAVAAFTAHRAREAATEPYARVVDNATGRPMDPARSCAAELAAALKVAPNTIGPWVDNARRLVGDLPEAYRALRCGAITLSKALALLDTTSHLPAPVQRAVARRVLERGPRQTHAQFRASLRRAVARVDVRREAERHRDALADRQCRRIDLPDGMAGLWVTHSADTIQQAWIAIRALADRANTDDPADTRTAEQRRADAAVDVFGHILANGVDWLERPLPVRQRRRPHIEVTVAATTLLGLDDQPGELAGYGPIPADLARRIATDGTWRRLLTDPATGAVIEAATTRHDPPAQVSETLLARHPRCAWTGCHRPARDCDRDHGIKHRHSGQTTLADLRPFCEYHHVIKDNDHWGWRIENHPDGSTRITAPTGHIYITHPPARDPAHDDPPPPTTDPDPPPF